MKIILCICDIMITSFRCGKTVVLDVTGRLYTLNGNYKHFIGRRRFMDNIKKENQNQRRGSLSSRLFTF